MAPQLQWLQCTCDDTTRQRSDLDSGVWPVANRSLLFCCTVVVALGVQMIAIHAIDIADVGTVVLACVREGDRQTVQVLLKQLLELGFHILFLQLPHLIRRCHQENTAPLTQSVAHCLLLFESLPKLQVESDKLVLEIVHVNLVVSLCIVGGDDQRISEPAQT